MKFKLKVISFFRKKLKLSIYLYNFIIISVFFNFVNLMYLFVTLCNLIYFTNQKIKYKIFIKNKNFKNHCC